MKAQAAAQARLVTVVALLVWTTAIAAGVGMLHRVDPSDAAHGTPVAAAVPVIEGIRLGGLVLGWYVLAVTVVGLAARLLRAELVTAVVDRLSTRALRRALDLATGVSLATAAVLVPAPGMAVAVADDTHSPPVTIRRLPDDDPHVGDRNDDNAPVTTTTPPGRTDDWPPHALQAPSAGTDGSSAEPEPAGGDAAVDPSGEPDPEALLDTLNGRGGDGSDRPPDRVPDDTARSPSAGPAPEGSGPAPRSSPDQTLASTPPSWRSDGAVEAHDQPGASDDPAASSSSPAPGPSSRPVPAPRPGTAPVASPRTHDVRPGDHFWSIATRVLGEAWGREPTVAEVEPYWRSLVDANSDRLVRRDDPDLIRPGQVFVVPEPPAVPPARPP